VGSPSGVIHSEATIRQHLTRSRFPGVILFEATRRLALQNNKVGFLVPAQPWSGREPLNQDYHELLAADWKHLAAIAFLRFALINPTDMKHRFLRSILLACYSLVRQRHHGAVPLSSATAIRDQTGRTVSWNTAILSAVTGRVTHLLPLMSIVVKPDQITRGWLGS
jgi:hypothetical protein